MFENVHDHQCIFSVIKLNFEYFQAGKQIFHPNISHAECAASLTEWDQYQDKMPLSALHVCFYVFYEKLTFRPMKTFNESFWTVVLDLIETCNTASLSLLMIDLAKWSTEIRIKRNFLGRCKIGNINLKTYSTWKHINMN